MQKRIENHFLYGKLNFAEIYMYKNKRRASDSLVVIIAKIGACISEIINVKCVIINNVNLHYKKKNIEKPYCANNLRK